ncbi:MAG: B12-binding domain-containing radical SAM protein [Planctomycetota bacterium]|jgi:radical SAM superfamily enzyme YgiQ (UPF0313 family)
MELPRRERGDELLPLGELTDIRRRLRAVAPKHDLATVIACAFDRRTRVLPFILADMRLAPAGVRAIGSAMVDLGFAKTRIVLQQWNRNFRPSQMRLDGRIPDLFMISSMQIHFAQCEAMIRDACTIDADRRPLIIVGGPKTIYEPWDVFSAEPGDPWAADVAVTGEEYVLLSLLEAVLDMRGNGESMRSAFIRARDRGALDGIPGLVYAKNGPSGVTEALIDTGIQRLNGDLDEMPHPALGYGLLEPPSRRPTLSSQALDSGRVHRHSVIGSLVLTLGCRFNCPYCPIPAYNQRQYRAKSGERIADEIERLYRKYRIRYYFGADDNFFSDQDRALDIVEALARKVEAGSRPHRKIRWGTEATVHDTLRMAEHLPLVRRAGLWALWLGVEDISGTLVKKGQSGDKTAEAFRLLRDSSIFPMPMMMHHDEQPLLSRGNNRGLLNQVRLLRKGGALSLQVLMLTPSPGSKLFVETYTSGLAYKRAGRVKVEPHIVDGNYVVASRHPTPWRKQLNLLLAYLYFYNPLRFLAALIVPKSTVPLAAEETRVQSQDSGSPRRSRLWRRFLRRSGAHVGDAAAQVYGMWGGLHTFRRTFVWMLRLMFCKIQRHTEAPTSQVSMRDPSGGPASHALPGTPVAPCDPVELSGSEVVKGVPLA